ncbi:hypothetical protein WJX84_000392 [Apatococcus fuscideae]|uniref:Uncharacterized protein n=1 Tax=Apatococcus fuscideae TaxID=2026836 RepID=A0AAW1SPK5_9CHLO
MAPFLTEPGQECEGWRESLGWCPGSNLRRELVEVLMHGIHYQAVVQEASPESVSIHDFAFSGHPSSGKWTIDTLTRTHSTVEAMKAIEAWSAEHRPMVSPTKTPTTSAMKFFHPSSPSPKKATVMSAPARREVEAKLGMGFSGTLGQT